MVVEDEVEEKEEVDENGEWRERERELQKHCPRRLKYPDGAG